MSGLTIEERNRTICDFFKKYIDDSSREKIINLINNDNYKDNMGDLDLLKMENLLKSNVQEEPNKIKEDLDYLNKVFKAYSDFNISKNPDSNNNILRKDFFKTIKDECMSNKYFSFFQGEVHIGGIKSRKYKKSRKSRKSRKYKKYKKYRKSRKIIK